MSPDDSVKDEAVRLLCPFTGGTKLARKSDKTPVWVQYYMGGHTYIYDNDLGHVSLPTSAIMQDFVPVEDYEGNPL